MPALLTIFTHPSGFLHDTGPYHPENISRLSVLSDMLKRWPEIAPGCPQPFKREDFPPASRSDLQLIHSSAHINRMWELHHKEGLVCLDDGDTVASPDTLKAALFAAGSVCAAVEDVCAGYNRRALCMIRPPGHHAEPDRAMGFCFFNNIFLGATLARRDYGLHKIAIVDFDVHHGNGSDTMARQTEGVFYLSTHEWPLFPGSGRPEENIAGKILNHILPPRSGTKEFRQIYRQHIFPALETYKPDLLMLSAGFDAHRRDPLSSINLEDDDFAWLTDELVQIAQKACSGRIISVLEGGYDLLALKNSAALHIKGLASGTCA